MPNNPIDTILARATGDIRKLLEEAFEAGRVAARDEIQRGISAYLSLGTKPMPSLLGSCAESPTITATEQTAERAPMGTVKPAIKELIENADRGITASEIIEKTGFKENSVRGTLSALKTDGFAERRGELWFLSKHEGPPALASEPS